MTEALRHPSVPAHHLCGTCRHWLKPQGKAAGKCDHDEAVTINGAGERLRFETAPQQGCDSWEVGNANQ